MTEHYLKFFHWPSATYLTATLFENIRDLLNFYKPSKNATKVSNDMAQYSSLLNTIKILFSNFKALSYCGVKLPQILEDSSYKSFVQAYQDSIIFIIEHGYGREGDMDTCGALWEELYVSCQDIMTVSIELLYSDTKSVVENLSLQLADENMSAKKAENCSFSLKFLSTQSNIAKLLQTKEDILSLKTIVKQLDRIQS